MFQSEQALLEAFIDATQALDPDIILGFEVQKGSLGYLADRAATMDLPLLKLVSRTPEVGSLRELSVHCDLLTATASGCIWCGLSQLHGPFPLRPRLAETASQEVRSVC